MQTIKKTFSLFLVLSVFLSCCSIHLFPVHTVAAQTYKTGHYTVNNLLNFRSGPSTETERVYSSYNSTTPIYAKKDARILVTKIDGDWGYTYLEGKPGWINLSYCTYINSYTPLTDKKSLIVDISQWQYDTLFDWNQMKADGVTGVILRVGGRYAYSDGSGSIYEDSRVRQHYSNAKAAGLDVGLYFFSYAMTAAGAAEEAQFCIDKIKEYGFECTLPIYIDLEDYSPDTSHFDAGKATNAIIIDSFCSTLENAGYYTGLYTNLYFMSNVIDTAVLENRSIWFAQYNETCTYEGRYDLWQYSCTSYFSGYSGGPLDANYCYRDYPTFIKANGYNGFKVTETPEEPDEPDEPDNPEAPDDPPFEGIEVHEHKQGNEITHKASCVQYGNKTANCSDPNCGALLKNSLISPTGHAVRKAYTVGDAPVAGESITKYSNAIDLISELDTLNAYTEISASGGNLISYCTTCNMIISSYRIDPYSVCFHEYNMTAANYKTTNLMYFRTGPTTSFRNITDSYGNDVYIEKDYTLNIYFEIGHWGYTSYKGYYGWVYLPYTTFISPAVYYYPTTKTNPSCTTEGKSLYACRHCKKTTYSNVDPILRHTAGTPVITSGSCRSYSYSTIYCKTCDERISYTVGSLGTHVYNMRVSKEPSNTTFGKADIKCYYCNKGGTVTLPSLLMCDCDSDGKITAADARSTLRFSVGMDSEKLTSAMIKRLDTDNSGSVNAADARNILRISVQLTLLEDLLLKYYS